MSRTDFEAAYIERYGHRPRGWSDDFQVYQDAHANGAWFGWQAGAAGIEAKAAPVGEREAFEAWAALSASLNMLVCKMRIRTVKVRPMLRTKSTRPSVPRFVV